MRPSQEKTRRLIRGDRGVRFGETEVLGEGRQRCQVKRDIGVKLGEREPDVSQG